MKNAIFSAGDMDAAAAAIKTVVSLCGASVAAFVAPVMPYGWMCTAMVIADFASAMMLARRLRKREGAPRVRRFSSRRFRATIVTLAKVYALLLLAHGVDVVIVGEDGVVSILRFAAALVCFWQGWSILENEASANEAPWARLAQRILIDKTERHLGIDLDELKSPAKPDEENE